MGYRLWFPLLTHATSPIYPNTTPNPPATASVLTAFFPSVGGQGAFVKDYNFDPLGLAEKAPEMVPWYRECEIKHGRIAMLAVVGFITAEYVRVPGDMYQVRSRNGAVRRM